MMMGRFSPTVLPMKTSPMRSYTSTLFLTTTMFILSWLPCQLTPLLLTPSDFLLHISLLPLIVGTCINPVLYAGQNKEVQEVIKKAYTRKKVVQCIDVATVAPVIQFSDPAVSIVSGEDKIVETRTQGWVVVIMLQVDRLGRYCSKVMVGEVDHSSNICNCAAPECEGTGV